jgi:hypothetical protein
MKKIIFTLGVFISLFSCTKEIQFQDDFKFKASGYDNSLVYIGTLRNLNIDLFDVTGATANVNYFVTFEKVIGNVEVYSNSQLIPENENLELSINDKRGIISYKPQSNGNIKFKIKVSNSLGIVKEQLIEIVGTNQDFNYTFTAQTGNLNPTLGQSPLIDLNITNTGLSMDTNFTFKYSSTKNGIFKIGNTTLVQSVSSAIPYGQVSATYQPLETGLHVVTLKCYNNNLLEKQVDLIFNVTEVPFILSIPNNNITCKVDTTIGNFQFQLNNLNTTLTYEYKFEYLNGNTITSDGEVRIQGQTTNLTNGIYYPLTVAPTNLYNFVSIPFNINSNKIRIYIKSSGGQIQSQILNLNVFDRPSITLITTSVVIAPSLTSRQMRYTLIGSQITNGAQIVEFEFQYLNTCTQQYVIITPNSLTSLNTLNLSNGSPCYPSWAFQQGTPYKARVKDSDGVWSNYYLGTLN